MNWARPSRPRAAVAGAGVDGGDAGTWEAVAAGLVAFGADGADTGGTAGTAGLAAPAAVELTPAGGAAAMAAATACVTAIAWATATACGVSTTVVVAAVVGRRSASRRRPEWPCPFEPLARRPWALPRTTGAAATAGFAAGLGVTGAATAVAGFTAACVTAGLAAGACRTFLHQLDSCLTMSIAESTAVAARASGRRSSPGRPSGTALVARPRRSDLMRYHERHGERHSDRRAWYERYWPQQSSSGLIDTQLPGLSGG